MKRMRLIVYLWRVTKYRRQNKNFFAYFCRTVNYSTDELARVADAISRFGFDNMY